MCKFCPDLPTRVHGPGIVRTISEFSATPEKDYNFVVKNEQSSDGLLYEMSEYFQTTPEDVVYVVDNKTDMLDLLVLTRCFTSKGNAAKAGWEKTIPRGFFSKKIGKYKTCITTLNIV